MLRESLPQLLILQFLKYNAVFDLSCPSLFSNLNIYLSILVPLQCLIIKTDTVFITYSVYFCAFLCVSLADRRRDHKLIAMMNKYHVMRYLTSCLLNQKLIELRPL